MNEDDREEIQQLHLSYSYNVSNLKECFDLNERKPKESVFCGTRLVSTKKEKQKRVFKTPVKDRGKERTYMVSKKCI